MMLRPARETDYFPHEDSRSKTPSPSLSLTHPAPMSARRTMINSGIVTNVTYSMAFVGIKRDTNVKEREVIIACRNLARKNHPDKNDFLLTGFNNTHSTDFLQTLNIDFNCARENEH